MKSTEKVKATLRCCFALFPNGAEDKMTNPSKCKFHWHLSINMLASNLSVIQRVRVTEHITCTL